MLLPCYLSAWRYTDTTVLLLHCFEWAKQRQNNWATVLSPVCGQPYFQQFVYNGSYHRVCIFPTVPFLGCDGASAVKRKLPMLSLDEWISMINESKRSKLQRELAVSYTHLDVYKRQALYTNLKYSLQTVIIKLFKNTFYID